LWPNSIGDCTLPRLMMSVVGLKIEYIFSTLEPLALTTRGATDQITQAPRAQKCSILCASPLARSVIISLPRLWRVRRSSSCTFDDLLGDAMSSRYSQSDDPDAALWSSDWISFLRRRPIASRYGTLGSTPSLQRCCKATVIRRVTTRTTPITAYCRSDENSVCKKPPVVITRRLFGLPPVRGRPPPAPPIIDRLERLGRQPIEAAGGTHRVRGTGDNKRP